MITPARVPYIHALISLGVLVMVLLAWQRVETPLCDPAQGEWERVSCDAPAAGTLRSAP